MLYSDYSQSLRNSNKSPSIYLCPENIKIICDPESNEVFQIILADVIIHEFAHGKMDDIGEEFKYMNNFREFFDSIEEPFANWFVLKYFYYSGNGHYFDLIKSSIKSQFEFYKLGYNFFHSNM